MRMLDENGKQIFCLTLSLTRYEANEMLEALLRLLAPRESDNFSDSEHVFDEEINLLSLEELLDRYKRFRPEGEPEPTMITTSFGTFLKGTSDIRNRQIQIEEIYDYDSIDKYSRPARDLLADCWGRIESIRDVPCSGEPGTSPPG